MLGRRLLVPNFIKDRRRIIPCLKSISFILIHQSIWNITIHDEIEEDKVIFVNSYYKDIQSKRNVVNQGHIVRYKGHMQQVSIITQLFCLENYLYQINYTNGISITTLIVDYVGRMKKTLNSYSYAIFQLWSKLFQRKVVYHKQWQEMISLS